MRLGVGGVYTAWRPIATSAIANGVTHSTVRTTQIRCQPFNCAIVCFPPGYLANFGNRVPDRGLRAVTSGAVGAERVAQAAGVSRSTIYLVFDSRAGLFDALAADLLQRGGFERMMRATTHPNPVEGLREVIRGGARMFAAHRDVLRALFSMAQLDADAVGGSIPRLEQNRAQGVAHRARRLADAGPLRRDVPIEEAAHVLWMLTSFDAFDLLYTGRGLSVEQAANTLFTTAQRSLCR